MITFVQAIVPTIFKAELISVGSPAISQLTVYYIRKPTMSLSRSSAPNADLKCLEFTLGCYLVYLLIYWSTETQHHKSFLETIYWSWEQLKLTNCLPVHHTPDGSLASNTRSLDMNPTDKKKRKGDTDDNGPSDKENFAIMNDKRSLVMNIPCRKGRKLDSEVSDKALGLDTHQPGIHLFAAAAANRVAFVLGKGRDFGTGSESARINGERSKILCRSCFGIQGKENEAELLSYPFADVLNDTYNGCLFSNALLLKSGSIGIEDDSYLLPGAVVLVQFGGYSSQVQLELKWAQVTKGRKAVVQLEVCKVSGTFLEKRLEYMGGVPSRQPAETLEEHVWEDPRGPPAVIPRLVRPDHLSPEALKIVSILANKVL